MRSPSVVALVPNIPIWNGRLKNEPVWRRILEADDEYLKSVVASTENFRWARGSSFSVIFGFEKKNGIVKRIQ